MLISSSLQMKSFIIVQYTILTPEAFLYRKNPDNSDTQKIAVIILKLEQNRFNTDELAQKM